MTRTTEALILAGFLAFTAACGKVNPAAPSSAAGAMQVPVFQSAMARLPGAPQLLPRNPALRATTEGLSEGDPYSECVPYVQRVDFTLISGGIRAVVYLSPDLPGPVQMTLVAYQLNGNGDFLPQEFYAGTELQRRIPAGTWSFQIPNLPEGWQADMLCGGYAPEPLTEETIDAYYWRTVGADTSMWH